MEIASLLPTRPWRTAMGRFRSVSALESDQAPLPQERKTFLGLSSSSRECPTYFREVRSNKKRIAQDACIWKIGAEKKHNHLKFESCQRTPAIHKELARRINTFLSLSHAPPRMPFAEKFKPKECEKEVPLSNMNENVQKHQW